MTSIDYVDVSSYSGINSELDLRNISHQMVINIESKKNYFRIWYKSLQD